VSDVIVIIITPEHIIGISIPIVITMIIIIKRFTLGDKAPYFEFAHIMVKDE
jgi:hypothetical protein